MVVGVVGAILYGDQSFFPKYIWYPESKLNVAWSLPLFMYDKW